MKKWMLTLVAVGGLVAAFLLWSPAASNAALFSSFSSTTSGWTCTGSSAGGGRCTCGPSDTCEGFDTACRNNGYTSVECTIPIGRDGKADYSRMSCECTAGSSLLVF